MNFNFPYIGDLEREPGADAVIVCHCKVVREVVIRDAVRSGAKSCRQVGRACDAGRQCGGCRPAIREIIRSESEPAGAFMPLDDLALSS